MLLNKKAQLEWSLGIAEGTHGPQGEEDEIANHLKVLAAEVRRLQKISDCLDADVVRRPCIICGEEMSHDPQVGSWCDNIGCITCWTAGKQNKYPIGGNE